jgi:hypothetical protein
MNKWMKRLGLGAAALALPLSTVAILGSGVAGAATVTVTYSAGKITITVNSGLTTGSVTLATLQATAACTGTKNGIDAFTNTPAKLDSVRAYSVKVATFGGKAACIHIPAGKLHVSSATSAKTLTITGNSGTTAAFIAVTGAPATCKIYTGTNLVLHNAMGLSTSTPRSFGVSPATTTLAFHIPAGCTTTSILPGITSIKISGSQTAKG